MHLFRALESVGEQEVKDGEGEKKPEASASLYFLLPTIELLLYTQRDGCLILSQHNPFLDVWIKHLGTSSWRLLLENKTRQGSGVLLPVQGQAPILSNLNYLLHILAAGQHPMATRLVY